MPGWLTQVCAASAVAAALYLLYVIVRPEDF